MPNQDKRVLGFLLACGGVWLVTHVFTVLSEAWTGSSLESPQQQPRVGIEIKAKYGRMHDYF
jgi:hypothetical protein